jgi:hypothetical protein
LRTDIRPGAAVCRLVESEKRLGATDLGLLAGQTGWCDIFGCGIEDLITVTATDARKRKTASTAAAASPNVVELNKSVRPGEPASSAVTINPQR